LLVPGPTPSTYAIETYTTTTSNGAKPSRAGRLAVGDLVAIVRLGRLVVKVVDRVAVRIAEQSHLGVVFEDDATRHNGVYKMYIYVVGAMLPGHSK
jgi:hypothetical protein